MLFQCTLTFSILMKCIYIISYLTYSTNFSNFSVYMYNDIKKLCEYFKLNY